MPSKASKPSKPEVAEKDRTICVPRERLALIYSLRPPTDAQKKILSNGRIHSWPGTVEFAASEAVKDVLTDIDIAWSDKK